MKKVTKTYCIREKSISYGVSAFSMLITFSNCKNSMRGLNYDSVLYTAPTTEMFTPETSRNRKYHIK